jgi:AraC family transcriptional activator of pobA
MDEILKLDSIIQFNTLRGIETLHPLVSVLDFSKMKLIPEAKAHYGFYCVFDTSKSVSEILSILQGC